MSNAETISLTGRESIAQVVEAMTLEEKARLLAGETPFRVGGVARLGIPPMVPADGHNGVNFRQLLWNVIPDALTDGGCDLAVVSPILRALRSVGDKGLRSLLLGEVEVDDFPQLPAHRRQRLQEAIDAARSALPDGGLPSCLPPGVVMGATWDPDLVHLCGQAVAKEARAFDVDVLLGPNVNIHRNPLCGRLFESYSEDPRLASAIAVAYIKGVQSQGIAADVKHFVANNQETHRLSVDARVSQRALREIYLPAFRSAIQEAKCLTVMSAYNKVNGTSCALNRWLLTDVLRKEWGFTGFVVSDWGAAYDRVEALRAGNDLEMPGPQAPQQLLDAVAQGLLTESQIDERVSNYLNVLVELPAVQGKAQEAIDRAFSAHAARRLAAEGAVLLKNDDGALPLRTTAPITVVGENARQPLPTGGGSAGVIAPYTVSLLEGLTARFGEESTSFLTSDQLADSAEGDALIISVGLTSREGADRATMDLPDDDVDLIRQAAKVAHAKGMKSILVLNVCGPVEMTEWIDDVDALLLIWLGGMELGNAVADLISGAVNPSGKLPLTWPRRYEDVPSAPSFPGEFGEVVYGEGIYVGYRYYDTFNVEPLYPFGYGLSYSSFQLSNLSLAASTLDLASDASLPFSVDLTNTSEVAGKEVVQVYVRDVDSTPERPRKELVVFEKVSLDPGEEQRVEFELHASDLKHYDPVRGTWLVEPGTFELLVGTSSRHIALSARFEAQGANPYAYGPKTPFRFLMADSRAAAIVRTYAPSPKLTAERLEQELTASPISMDEVWRTRFAPLMEGLNEEEKRARRQEMFQRLAALAP